MPNTLAHLGVQGVASRVAIPGADLKWVYLGCVVPDAPWILRRVALALPVEVPAYDLRLYAIAQSSLFLCLVLAAGLAAFARRPMRVFAILALNALLHLLLDPLQTKWGNGAHLFAPLSWHLVSFDLFWPEDAATWALTGFGLAFFVYAWWRLPPPAFDLVWPRGRRAALASVALLAYVLLPFALFPPLRAAAPADAHYATTFADREGRAGRWVEFDRAAYLDRPAGGDALRNWAGEEIAVAGDPLDRPATVSARGRFVDGGTVEIRDLHVHATGLRDLASYVGLALVLAYWLRALREPLAAAGGRGRRAVRPSA